MDARQSGGLDLENAAFKPVGGAMFPASRGLSMRPPLLASIFLWIFLVSISSCSTAQSANLLINPGFEADPLAPSQALTSWNLYGPNNYRQTNAAIAHSGTYFYKVYQGFTASVNYTGIYQDHIAGPGAVYSGGGWGYTSSADTLAGQNVGWIEITFRDAGGSILALYRSTLITTNLISTGQFPKSSWVYLPITNQYDPGTFTITNTISALVAPARTSFVRYQIVFQGDSHFSTGSLYFDDLDLEQVGGAPYGNWNLTWSDEFNGSVINPSVWTFDIGTGSGGWGNNELEYYTSRPTNAFVSGGLLHIVARQESYNGSSYTSARMKTQGLYSKTRGRFEFRARMPQGIGFWPALWMLGTNITSVGWPNCGEIDVLENNGAYPANVQGSLHSGSDETKVYTLPGDSVTNFHSYLLEWTSNAINWFVDGLLYETQTNWSSSIGPYPAPFDRPFFILMNLAIGGNYVGNPSAGTINANSSFPAELQVDYVRIYEQTAPLQLSVTLSNANLVLSWPTNIICHLQSQNNSASGGLTGDWLDLPAATSPFLATPTNAVGFYRLASP